MSSIANSNILFLYIYLLIGNQKIITSDTSFLEFKAQSHMYYIYSVDITGIVH